MKKVLATMVMMTLILCGISTMRVKAVTTDELHVTEQQEVNDILIQVENIDLVDCIYKDETIIESDCEKTVMSYYIVTKEGETVKSIAERLQITEEYLLSENPDCKINTNDVFEIGTYVTVPGVDWNVLEDVYYIVQKGDCLWTISEYFYTTVEEVWDLNPKMKNPNIIYTGNVIRVK